MLLFEGCYRRRELDGVSTRYTAAQDRRQRSEVLAVRAMKGAEVEATRKSGRRKSKSGAGMGGGRGEEIGGRNPKRLAFITYVWIEKQAPKRDATRRAGCLFAVHRGASRLGACCHINTPPMFRLEPAFPARPFSYQMHHHLFACFLAFILIAF